MTTPMADGLISLTDFAKKMNRTADCVYKWKLHGRLNRFKNERVYCEFTRLPSGAWAVSQVQYDAFIANLNEKP